MQRPRRRKNGWQGEKLSERSNAIRTQKWGWGIGETSVMRPGGSKDIK